MSCSCAAESTAPVGLLGEFTQIAFTPGMLRHESTAATSSTLTTVAPATWVPIS